LVFRWVFIPWLQHELDVYRHRVNNTAKRADRNKGLPHGVPTEMWEHPGDFGVLDFKVFCQLQFAPRENEVFQLVPPDFHAIIAQIYVEIGEPPVTRGSCWDVYRQLLSAFRALDEAHHIPHDIDTEWGYMTAGDEHAGDIELAPNLQPLRNGDDVVGQDGFYYMGGVNNGEGLDTFPRAGYLFDTDSVTDWTRYQSALRQKKVMRLFAVGRLVQLGPRQRAAPGV
ncbi:hypothetical protein C8F04DRAFT_958458, partial [Mycena alexandri]